MKADFEDKLNRVLKPNEEVLWKGAPKGGLHLQPMDGFMIPFSIFWLGFVIFWEYNALRIGSRSMFPLFGIPFILAGLYIVFGRYIHAAYLDARTCYAVTSRRIIILTPRSSRFIPLSKIPALEKRVRRSGLSSIYFEKISYEQSFRRSRFFGNQDMDAFKNLADANEVYELIESRMIDKA